MNDTMKEKMKIAIIEDGYGMSTITTIIKIGQDNTRNNAPNKTLRNTYIHLCNTVLTLTIFSLQTMNDELATQELH